jgi:RNA polymerase sigma-70 factor (ECF subfamily)
MKLRKEKAIAKNEERFKKYISAEIMELADEIHLNNDADGEDIFEKLNMAVKNLKNEQRVCIEMLYLQNKSYGDVAEVTGLTMKQVKSHIQNGKRNLKIYLEKRQSK